MHSKLFAVMATVGLVLFALGPGVATAAAQTAGNDSLDIAVTQDGDDPTVTVTDNGTGVANASVVVEALDNASYDGVGNYTTDANGTVELPAPEANVTVEATTTVDNVTVSTTANLTAGAEERESFGSMVSAFVKSLQEGNETNVGQQVAEFVTANNPGNAPDHAGPPENAGPPEDRGPGAADDDENETDDRPGNAPDGAGPPADRGNGNAGPPEDRGNGNAGPKDVDDEEGTDEVETEDADEADEETEEETEDADEADEETEDDDDDGDADDDDDGDRRGPPSNANAGGNGNGR